MMSYGRPVTLHGPGQPVGVKEVEGPIVRGGEATPSEGVWVWQVVEPKAQLPQIIIPVRYCNLQQWRILLLRLPLDP